MSRERLPYYIVGGCVALASIAFFLPLWSPVIHHGTPRSSASSYERDIRKVLYGRLRDGLPIPHDAEEFRTFLAATDFWEEINQNVVAIRDTEEGSIIIEWVRGGGYPREQLVYRMHSPAEFELRAESPKREDGR